jgi:DNA-directed RNA polymerase specialized sigma24 family protein
MHWSRHSAAPCVKPFFTGATYNELAARCKVPLGTMKSWIRRSLLQLRTCLER